MSGDFFKGYVHLVSQGIINAKYSITENNGIIKVLNSTHVRMVQNQYGGYPDSFEIIAPMDAVKLIEGEIPSDHIQYLSASTYLAYRQQYQGI